MGKSIRSKIKKRLRTVKRERVDAMICVPQAAEKHEALKRVSQGRAVTLSRPKNAFKYPNDDGAAFPQHEILKPIDFRAQNLPMAGYAFRGNRRKYVGEQAEFMDNLKKTSHPKMEVLAGGGAILARDGRRISKHEAEVLATAAAGRHDAARQAVASGPLSAAPAVASSSATIGTDSRGDMEMGGNEEVEHPQGAADHSRRPVVKDTRRAARTAEPRARTISSKKKIRGKRLQAEANAEGDDEEDEEPEAPVAPPAAAPAKVKPDAPAEGKLKIKKKTLKKKRSKAGGEAMDED